MNNNRFACQTITFGDNQSSDFPTVLSSISQAGYAGVEIGFRHLASVPTPELKHQLAENELTLAASHIGGNLADLDQAGSERNMLDTTIAKLAELNVDTLMYSGLHFENSRQFDADLEMLFNAAIQCSRNNIRLLYHNHAWEFDNEQYIMQALLAKAPAELGFCPDVGWIDKAGVDVMTFLEQITDRIGAVHLKDFASRNRDVTDTVELGNGVVPLKQVLNWAENHLPADVWKIAEQDKSELTAADAITRNAEFLMSCI